MDDRKIKSFTDLNAWKESHVLAIAIYQLTEIFPNSEQYGLSSQLKRAASSVTSNIAEGFGRSTSRDKEHFYTMASGSLYEIKSQLILCRDLGFIKNEKFQQVATQANTAHKLLNGLIKSHKGTKKPNV
jgi:four helix bundle protein